MYVRALITSYAVLSIVWWHTRASVTLTHLDEVAVHPHAGAAAHAQTRLCHQRRLLRQQLLAVLLHASVFWTRVRVWSCGGGSMGGGRLRQWPRVACQLDAAPIHAHMGCVAHRGVLLQSKSTMPHFAAHTGSMNPEVLQVCT